MAFKMRGFSAFTKPTEQPKDHQTKFFKETDREVRRRKSTKHPEGKDISTETIGKEKNWGGSVRGQGGKLKEFTKITDNKTGKVTYVKKVKKKDNYRKADKEISEKKYLRKKKKYEKKKGFDHYDYDWSNKPKSKDISRGRNTINTYNPNYGE